MLNIISISQLTSIIEITPMNVKFSYCINSRMVNSIDQYLPVFSSICRYLRVNTNVPLAWKILIFAGILPALIIKVSVDATTCYID